MTVWIQQRETKRKIIEKESLAEVKQQPAGCENTSRKIAVRRRLAENMLLVEIRQKIASGSSAGKTRESCLSGSKIE